MENEELQRFLRKCEGDVKVKIETPDGELHDITAYSIRGGQPDGTEDYISLSFPATIKCPRCESTAHTLTNPLKFW